MKDEFRISVRTLVELLMRHGSIDNRYVSSTKAIEGIKGHQKVQKSYGDNYESEVPLKHTIEFDDMIIKIEGRADGILKENNKIIIDEIKTTTRELLMIDEDFNPLHFAQAKCYGFIYCNDNNLENIDIQLTYFNIETENTRIIRKNFEYSYLKDFFNNLINDYREWCIYEKEWIKIRDRSIKELKFPFDNYRKGQRELAVRVYKAIENSKKCFSQAPTGIGKTISTLFPSIKAMGEKQTTKIFYLTAKTITREVAEKTINIMRKQKLNIKSLTITAKDKVCKMDECNCNPEYCPYANGFYDRINEALNKILQRNGDFSRQNIDMLSDEFMLCPFELSLELSLFSDIIICDYNYVFDPKVYLKRFFDVKSTEYTFLIDEAHNLVDRARSMYSISLIEEDFEKIKKQIVKGNRKLTNIIKEILLFFAEKKVELDTLNEDLIIDKDSPNDLYNILPIFIKYCDEYLANNKDDNKELLDLYFQVHSFMTIYEYYNDKFVTLYEKKSNKIFIKLYCVNPSEIIIDKMKIAKSNIIFSATLIPLSYFKDMYGYNEEDYIANLKSPFDVNNRLLLIGDNIATTYTKRNETSEEIVDYIFNLIQSKKGNYMVFFPSYKYMNLIYDAFIQKHKDISVIIQENEMSEEDKEEFLSLFNENNKETHIGFCVLGGHFSEGIDLTNDKLIGVIIVGVGMPQIGVERNIIKDYMNDNNKGFEYAYVYPGIIKVLQAAGRCIRTDKDKGVIMLLDNRYNQKRYYELFPYDWMFNTRVRNSNEVSEACTLFWK